MDKCPIKSPENRTRALIAFELLRAALVLAIIGWWGWLLISKTRQIVALEGSIDKTQVMRMIYWEAGTLFILVGVSTALSLYFYLRDAARTRQLKAFFAGMAHELRTPLSSIRLQADALARQVQSPLTERLIADTARLEAQIERGFALARLENGRKLELAALDPAEHLQRALALFPKAEQVRISLKSGALPTILAEAECVQVIFRNILENALAHSGKKKLVVRLEAQEKAVGAVQLVFHDNGAGFKGPREKLGTMFFKGAASRGTGLGLYLIRTLMEAQGGKARFSAHKNFLVALTFRRPPHA